jgi:hypothetical protein
MPAAHRVEEYRTMATDGVVFRPALYLSMLAFSTAAVAQGRPYTPSMPCREASALVTARGAVVLSTGPNSYERVVAHGGLCSVEETSAPAWEPTADNPRCFVGYRCKDKMNEGPDPSH